jgi:hypothetical protein
MLILFDHGTPKGLARALPGHTIITAQARGWDKLNNGAVLNAVSTVAILKAYPRRGSRACRLE